MVFNLTDPHGDSVDKNVTVPPSEKSTSTPLPPLIWNMTDLQGDSVDKNATVPPPEKTTSTPLPILVFNVTDPHGDSVDKNVTVPPSEKSTSTPLPPLIWNMTDLQGDSVDKNATAPSVDKTTSPSIVFTLTVQNNTTDHPSINITESNDGFEMDKINPALNLEEVPLGGDFHKSFLETEVDTLNDKDDDYDEESEFYKEDLKNYGVNVDMLESEENDDFLLPQRVKSASEEKFDKQMGINTRIYDV